MKATIKTNKANDTAVLTLTDTDAAPTRTVNATLYMIAAAVEMTSSAQRWAVGVSAGDQTISIETMTGAAEEMAAAFACLHAAVRATKGNVTVVPAYTDEEIARAARTARGIGPKKTR